MSDYALAVAQLDQRSNVATNFLQSELDGTANLKVQRLQTRVQEFLDSCHGRPNFHRHHPALFLTVDSLVDSLVTHCSATQARGNGRIAMISDHIRSTGNGLRRALPAIRDFLNQPQPIDWVVDKRTHISYPVDDKVMRTHVTLSQLYGKLMERNAVIKEHQRNGTKPSKEEAYEYLLGPSWDEGKILGYVIEGAARSVAFAIPQDQKEGLIGGNLPLLTAISTVDWAPA